MSRIDLKTYHKNFFKDVCEHEKIREINAAHAISSECYDVQFGRNTLIYRDNENKLSIPIEHDMTHVIIIYLEYFLENNNCSIDVNTLKRRISTILMFLKVRHRFE